ncbi:MATE family efflux transporter [Clostridium taeniosporum]|uniref:MATE family efflux transporter n=1 Tax=Clostridium taeniosporum TaxID=394958 RepID=A0A1D7XL54_9CLOT|nr:MATE family efflux transporter [Clostridium taeniosporum]AOR23839.1 MATE family efflux transporter [Clostridium taeniosporum]
MSGINVLEQKNKSINSLFKLTWPIFIELILQMLVSNVDQLMLSRVSENAVAAVGNVNQIMNFLLITFSIITMATTILVSQYLGAENYEKVSEIYSVAIFSNLAFSILISIILLCFNGIFFKWLQMPDELLRNAKMYISIIGGGIFLQAIFMTYSAILRSNGLMKQGMYVSAVFNVINILGNFLFISGAFGIPKLGVEGVAISSVVSRFVGVMFIIYIFKHNIKQQVSFKYLNPFPKEIFKKLMNIGLPSGGESVSYNLSQMVILTFINIMGTSSIATKAYVGILAWFSFIYGSAVSQGNQIRIGYLIGGNDEEEAYKKVLQTLKPAAFVSVIVSILLFLFSDNLLRVFTSNPEILNLGKKVLFIDIFLEFGRAFNLVIIRGMQAAGDIKYPIFIGVLSMWIVATGLSYVFGIVFKMGLVGIWLAMMCDECLRGLIFYIRWRRGKWRAKCIVT